MNQIKFVLTSIRINNIGFNKKFKILIFLKEVSYEKAVSFTLWNLYSIKRN